MLNRNAAQGPQRLAVLVVVQFILALPGASRAADPVTRATLFTAATEGFAVYRIPSLILTPQGTALAFCEGRRKGPKDSGEIATLLRRSLDSGASWEPQRILFNEPGYGTGNPCPVALAGDGGVVILLTRNNALDGEYAIMHSKSREGRTVWISRSADEGVTWLAPREITTSVKRPEWRWYATGPGVGLQLSGGRLLIPCDHSDAESKLYSSHTILSDDGGATWRIGGVLAPNSNECQAVELTGGRVMLNMRNHTRDDPERSNRRMVAVSADGGESFGPVAYSKELIEPVCQASLFNYGAPPSAAPGAAPLLLFSNPAGLKRERLTVRVSRDEGVTWSAGSVLQAGPAGYSCLARLPNGRVACMFERGEKILHEGIEFATFPLDWIN